MTLPRVAREPVMEQTFDIAGEKVAQPAALRLLVKRIFTRESFRS